MPPNAREAAAGGEDLESRIRLIASAAKERNPDGFKLPNTDDRVERQQQQQQQQHQQHHHHHQQQQQLLLQQQQQQHYLGFQPLPMMAHNPYQHQQLQQPPVVVDNYTYVNPFSGQLFQITSNAVNVPISFRTD